MLDGAPPHPSHYRSNPAQALDPATRHLVGVVVCKQERHRSGTDRGYIAMLAVETSHRGQGLGSRLVERAIASMAARGADEVVLETETDNAASLRLYERLGFVRMKHLHRYYLNGNGAFRLMRRLRDLGSHQGSSDERVLDRP
jgi:peptide alpha-N-acetyltransferase